MDVIVQITKICNGCGAIVSCEERGSWVVPLRHQAPCGAVCVAGSANGDGFDPKEPRHDPPWNGPPETDGHYHGECPKGCFKDCCNPPGNLCGPKCLQCFGCRVCGYLHAPEEKCKGL